MGAIKEMATSVVGELVLFEAAPTGTDVSAAIDTANYEDGITFLMGVNALQNGVKHTMTFTHSDDDTTGFVAVDSTNLVYGRGGTDVNIDNDSGSPVAIPSACAREGLVGTKRYVKVTLTSTGTTTGSTVVIMVFKNGEVVPVSESGSVYYPVP